MSASSARNTAAIYVLAILMLAAIAVAAVLYEISIISFTVDVAAIAEIHPFVGLLSNLGIYLWCISASAGFFAAMILRDIGQTEKCSFLLSSALLSAYLMLDDAFLFHEVLAYEFFRISEEFVFAALGVAVLVYLKTFLNVIVKTQYATLVLAFTFLSLSVFTDAVLEPWLSQIGQWEFFIEDGTKWLGIVSWCIYHVRTAFLFVVQAYKLPDNANAT